MSNSHVRNSQSQELREFLDDRGLRYQWVAEKLGVTPSHMTRLMDGQRPITHDLALKLSGLFDVPADTFLTQTPEQDNG
jgi:plasmid maintenance system antidote protein VapI